MCIPGSGDSRAKAWKCGAWCVWQNGALDQRECEGLVGGEAATSSWGQTVKSLKCQAKDSDCVVVRAGFSERSPAMVSQGHTVPQADGRGCYSWRQGTWGGWYNCPGQRP